MLSEKKTAQMLTEVEEAYPGVKDLYKKCELLGIKLALLTVLEGFNETYWNNRINALIGKL